MPWRTRIVGRGPEIAELDSQWQRAAAGEFRFVLVVGEPGMAGQVGHVLQGDTVRGP